MSARLERLAEGLDAAALEALIGGQPRMTAPEFSRPVRIDTIGEAPRKLHVEAEEVERINLARRFGLAAIDRLAADLTLSGKAATWSR